MRLAERQSDTALNLLVGEIVEVRGPEEILATLDEQGTLEALLFMPEMLQWCGKRFRVSKRADRTCDTIENTGMRRMKNTVHLENLRCDGEGHGGCQAGCLVFWKEAWLERVLHRNGDRDGRPVEIEAARAYLMQFARQAPGPDDSVEATYSCQATELRKATCELKDPEWRQVLRDLLSGTLSVTQVVQVLLIRLFNRIQAFRGGLRYPSLGVGSGFGGRSSKTPRRVLDLVPGEYVQVRNTDEIRETLDEDNKNRGLKFDMEMVRYCGGRYRVQKRVEKIINERTGKMMQLPNDCVILDNVVCTAEFHQLCSRSIYPYWREIWLRRAEEDPLQRPSKRCVS